MAKAKTTENDNNVSDFLKEIPDPERQKDAFAILDIMETVSGFRAKMWGPAIIGFGSFHYKYKSGHEGDSPLIGFSPRKNAFALYLSSGFANREKLLASFGKYKSGKVCLYVKKLADVDTKVLQEMIALSLRHTLDTNSVC